MWIALEDRQRLRAGIEHARGAADQCPDAALDDLLLGDQVALLVAAAVADPHIGAVPLDGVEHLVGVLERERDRLLHQHRFAELDRRQDRREMLAFAGGDDHGIDLGPGNHRIVVAGMELRPDGLGELARLGGVLIGHRDGAHRRMPGRQPRPQGADAA